MTYLQLPSNISQIVRIPRSSATIFFGKLCSKQVMQQYSNGQCRLATLSKDLHKYWKHLNYLKNHSFVVELIDTCYSYFYLFMASRCRKKCINKNKTTRGKFNQYIYFEIFMSIIFRGEISSGSIFENFCWPCKFKHKNN